MNVCHDTTGSDGPSHTVYRPFAEARELVAGYSIWEAKGIRGRGMGEGEAPSRSGRSRIGLRPFYEAEDMTEALNLETRAP